MRFEIAICVRRAPPLYLVFGEASFTDFVDADVEVCDVHRGTPNSMASIPASVSMMIPSVNVTSAELRISRQRELADCGENLNGINALRCVVARLPSAPSMRAVVGADSE